MADLKNLSTLELFNFKSDYLVHSGGYEEIDLTSFLELIFMFNKDDIDYPFEDKECVEYIRWRNGTEDENRYIQGQPYVYNPITLSEEVKEDKRGQEYEGKENRLVLRDCIDKTIDHAKGHKFIVMSPITYVGKRASYENARFLFALAFDLDGVGVSEIKELFYQIDHEGKHLFLPRPNIIVNSGNGLHLYYLLEKPIPMYGNFIPLLNKLKRALTYSIWNGATSTFKKRQVQSIVQAFRLPESLTKFGETIRAFYDREVHLWNIEKLNNSLHHPTLTDEEVALLDDNKKIPNRLTLDGAKEQYPEWYQRVVVEKKKGGKKWNVNRGLYYWWLNKVRKNETKELLEGHRYYCVLTLVSFAVKCNVPYEEVKKDVLDLVPYLETFTESEDNHFTEKDALSALNAYKDDSARMSISSIERLTAFRIDKSKRNGRKQHEHIKVMNLMRDNITHPNGSWRECNGRKPKKDIVLEWRKDNPNGSKYQCIKETKVSKPTVYKWWTAYDEYLEGLAKEGKYLSTDIFDSKESRIYNSLTDTYEDIT